MFGKRYVAKRRRFLGPLLAFRVLRVGHKAVRHAETARMWGDTKKYRWARCVTETADVLARLGWKVEPVLLYQQDVPLAMWWSPDGSSVVRTSEFFTESLRVCGVPSRSFDGVSLLSRLDRHTLSSEEGRLRAFVWAVEQNYRDIAELLADLIPDSLVETALEQTGYNYLMVELFARRSTLPVWVRHRVCGDHHYLVEQMLASPWCDEVAVEIVARSEYADEYQRAAAAGHVLCSVEILERLAYDESAMVRAAVAAAALTPAHLLDYLAYDDVVGVRRMVASHQNSSTETLDRLASDLAADVRVMVLNNPRASARARVLAGLNVSDVGR